MAEKFQTHEAPKGSHRAQPSISSYNRATSIKFIQEKQKQLGDFDKASIFKKRSIQQSVNANKISDLQRNEKIQKLNQAIKDNKRSTLFVSESKFDAGGLSKRRVVETGSSSEQPSEPMPVEQNKPSIVQSETPIILEDPELKVPDQIDLKMTMVAPKMPQPQQNMPTQNSLSINDEEEPVETIANIEMPAQKLRDFPIEFDFSNHRKSVRTEYLKSLGFDESQIKKMFQK